MKRAPLTVLIVALIVVSAACQQAGQLSEQDKAAIQKQHDQYAQTVVTQNPAPADLVKAYYSDDAKVLPPNVPAMTDRDAIARMFTAPGGAAKTFKFDQVVIDGRGDMAFVYGLWQADWKLPTGATEPAKGKFLETWKKQGDGTWKALYSTWNSDQPAGFTVPTGTMKADAPPEAKSLDAFAGTWLVENEMQASPFGPAGKATAVLDCRWFANGLSVVCKAEGDMPNGPYREVFFMGYNPEAKAYSGYDVDNAGVMTPMGIAFKENTWTLTWDLKAGGKPLKIRGLVKHPTNDAWGWRQEYSTGGAWAPLGEATVKRIGK